VLVEQPTRLEPGNDILNIESLKRKCLTQMSRGQPGSVEKAESDCKAARVVFDVLTLRQLRLQTLMSETENRRIPTWVKKELTKQAVKSHESVLTALYNRLPGLPRIFQHR
jgi:hypothetical protein